MATPAIKRQRKRRRIDEDGDPEFQVAPMVDVLLVLMLFFMAITSTEVLQKDKNLTLAEAKHAKKIEGNKKNEIVINVGWDGVDSTAQFSMGGIPYATAGAMQESLTTRHQDRPEAYVVIRADKDAQYSNIAEVMNACASAGISTVTFAVLTVAGGDANHKAPAAGAGSN
jgi:biopolymer transport protein ExbD